MKIKALVSRTLHGLYMAAASLVVLQTSVGQGLAATPAAPATPAFGGLWNSGTDRSGRTATPIKHVIVIIGENRSFDHVFATYVPKRGQTVHNLLSEGIIQLDANKNAIPGPNFRKAQQLSASDLGSQDTFLLSPPKQEFPANQLPAPEAGGPSGAHGYFTPSSSKYTTVACGTTTANGKTTTNYLDPAACAALTENGLPDATDANGLTYYQSLASGGTGQYSYTPDLRIVNFDSLPAGPFQLTNGTNSATAGLQPHVHGLQRKSGPPLLPDVAAAQLQPRARLAGQPFRLQRQAVLLGGGDRRRRHQRPDPGPVRPGLLRPPPSVSSSSTPPGIPPTNPPTAAQWTANEYALYDSVPTTTGEGSSALGFYNVQQGDAPYFKSLADTYAMSDNFHQSVNGGTGVNHIMLGHGDAIWFSDGNGNPQTPPHNVAVTTNPAGFGGTGTIDEIENPNPAPATNNWYSQDGYGEDYNAGYPTSEWDTTQGNGLPIIYGGGSYSDCSDSSQPGVGPILDYLKKLHIDPRCEPGHYYLLNNYNPGWFGNGNNAYTDQNPSNTPFTDSAFFHAQHRR